MIERFRNAYIYCESFRNAKLYFLVINIAGRFIER